MFSRRLPPNPVANALSCRLEEIRHAGGSWVDLTESNPTRAGFAYPQDLLCAMADTRALSYEPHPFGMIHARAAVAADCTRRGATIDPAQIVLTASTSEAYAWLFKLLCDPDDRVLVPRPSYPLFEHLTRLEGVRAEPYDLEYHRRWTVDFVSLARAATAGARAILVVSPNNPTGSYMTRSELARVSDICARSGLALVVDEVFADYPLDAPDDRVTDVALATDVLAFSLGGLSKTVGLPQLKLAWIVVGGSAPTRDEALRSLELIADSYLSVSTPVQIAAGELLARGAAVREQIHGRARVNLDALRQAAARFPACEVLSCEGGWYAVVRVPAHRTEEALVLELLERERILAHPGYFFDFPREAYLVVSLLLPPDVFAGAADRMLRLASD